MRIVVRNASSSNGRKTDFESDNLRSSRREAATMNVVNKLSVYEAKQYFGEDKWVGTDEPFGYGDKIMEHNGDWELTSPHGGTLILTDKQFKDYYIEIKTI